MPRRHFGILPLVIGLLLAGSTSAAEEKKPNVVVLLVDDMGYSDPGYMGGEAQTPNLDRLSKEGVTFLNCFNNAKCAPYRAALMTGMTCQRVKAFKSKGNVTANNATSIAEVLGASGYTTIISGKWHIAPDPLEVGFQHYYGVNLAPFYFKRDVVGEARDKAPHPLKLQDDRVDGKTLPDDWYSTTAYTDYGIKTIKEQALDKGKPFFLYLSVNAPHGPLSAPKEVVDKYATAYDAGTDVARQRRYKRMADMGLIDPETLKLPEMAEGKKGNSLAWSTFSDKEKRLYKRKLAIVAAMVDVIDQETGKLIKFLKDEDQYDNTLFIFLSDNGATAEKGAYGGLPFQKMTNEDIDVLGTRAGMPGGTSGAVVARVQNTPFRGYKTSLWDGGMRTSMIVNWPKVKRKTDSHLIRTPVSIYDLAPTVYEITKVAYPEQINGRDLKPMDGVSFLPLMNGRALADRYIRYAYKGDQVIRDSNFKLFGKRNKGRSKWALYHLATDESEMHDVIDQHPEQAKKMIEAWRIFDKYANISQGYDDYFGGKSEKKNADQ